MARKDENTMMLRAQVNAALRHADELITTPGAMIVSLERYPRTNMAPAQFGVHLMAPGNLMGDDPDWGHFTVGLYREDDLAVFWDLLLAQYGQRQDPADYASLPQDVRDYIHDRIIPMEWKDMETEALAKLIYVTPIKIEDETLPGAGIKDASAEETNEFFGALSSRGTVLFNRSTWVCDLPEPTLKLYVEAEVFHGDYDVARMRNVGWFLNGILTLARFRVESQEGYGVSGDEVLYAYLTDLEDARGRVIAGGYSYEDFLGMVRMMSTSINADVAHVAGHLLRVVLEEK